MPHASRLGPRKAKVKTPLKKKPKNQTCKPRPVPHRHSCGLCSFSRLDQEVEGSEVKMSQLLWLHEPFEPEIHPPTPERDLCVCFIFLFLFLFSIILIPPLSHKTVL